MFKKSVIAIDVDLTIVDIMPAWLLYLNNIAGTNRTIEECGWDYNLGNHFPELKVMGIDPMSFWDSDNLYEQLRPLPGCVEAISKLKEKGHNIVFVSHTKRLHFSSKVRFVKRHFPFLELGNISSGDGFVATHEKGVLSDVDVFIDDRLKYFPLFKVDTLKIQMKTPYTQDFNGDVSLDLVTSDWEQIYCFLEDIL